MRQRRIDQRRSNVDTTRNELAQLRVAFVLVPVVVVGGRHSSDQLFFFFFFF